MQKNAWLIAAYWFHNSPMSWLPRIFEPFANQFCFYWSLAMASVIIKLFLASSVMLSAHYLHWHPLFLFPLTCTWLMLLEILFNIDAFPNHWSSCFLSFVRISLHWPIFCLKFPISFLLRFCFQYEIF